MSTKGRDTIAAFGAVMRDPSLTPELKVLWSLYRVYDFKGKGAFPGDETLAEHLGKSARSVQGYRAELLRRGYLTQQKRGPRPAVYRAVLPNDTAPPRAPHANGDGPWAQYGVDSAEEVVRKLEIMFRIERNDEDVPDEMRDTFGELYDALNHDVLNNLSCAYGDKGWPAWRREVHKQIPSLVAAINAEWQDIADWRAAHA